MSRSKVNQINDLASETVVTILRCYRDHVTKLEECGKAQPGLALTDTQLRVLADKITGALRGAGIVDYTEVERNFGEKVAFQLGSAIGTPIGFADGLLHAIPGYESFKAGFAYGHGRGFSAEQRCVAWSKAKVQNLADKLPAMPWRKAPELNSKVEDTVNTGDRQVAGCPV